MNRSAAGAGTTAIGFGVETITPGPSHWPIWLAGYGDRRDPARVVHDDLEVRVMVARSDTVTVALVVCDLMAMSQDWANAIRSAVADELGVTVDRVLTSTVHTHAAPSTITGTEALGWNVPHEWRTDLVVACCSAARQASDSARPARLRSARLGLPDALSFNRRGHSYAPTYCVVDVIDADDEQRIGTIVNFSVHPVVLGPDNYDVSADWVGVCRREVEARLGGATLFVQGCQGDVDPHGMSWDADVPTRFAAVARVGEDFALAAVAGVAVAVDTTADRGVGIELTSRTIEIDATGSPMAAITRREWLEVDLHEWSISGVQFVSVPGEGFAQLGHAIVAARSPVPTVLVGFAPHWLGYFPVPFGEGYEEGLSYGAAAVDAIAAALTGSR